MIWRLHLGLALLLFTCGPCLLAEESRGTVVRVAPERNQLTVELRGRRMRGSTRTFTLDADARVLIGSQPAELKNVHPGDRVRISYEDRDGEAVATRIAVRGALLRPSEEASLPSDPNAITGVLQRVGLSDREIVVVGPAPQGGEMETTLTVPESAHIRKNGGPVKLDDLREGENVIVHASKEGDKMIAGSVEVGSAEANATARPAATKKARIEKIRQILRYVDHFLQQREDQPEHPVP